MKNRLDSLLKKIRTSFNKNREDKSYGYDRERAKSYAETYALTANTKKYPLYKENDCVNFVSQAMAEGGMKMKGNDFKIFSNWFCYTNNPNLLQKTSLTWRSSQYFRMYWGNRNGEGSNMAGSFKKMTVDEAIRNYDAIYEELMVGDVIQYGDTNDIAYHTQIIHAKEINPVSGKDEIFVAQHTANRKHVSLYDYLRLLNNKKTKYVYTYHF